MFSVKYTFKHSNALNLSLLLIVCPFRTESGLDGDGNRGIIEANDAAGQRQHDDETTANKSDTFPVAKMNFVDDEIDVNVEFSSAEHNAVCRVDDFSGRATQVLATMCSSLSVANQESISNSNVVESRLLLIRCSGHEIFTIIQFIKFSIR